jgi:glycerol-3-phosphate dehydrogenase (NAD(P)+)
MIGVLGGGAFGTALAVVLGRSGSEVRLWSRSAATLNGEMPRLPGVSLGDHVQVTPNMDDLYPADPVLLALPMQALSAVLHDHHAALDGRVLIACCKGVDLETGLGPSGVVAAVCPQARVAVLTGPSFAADIARGLPTALTLACGDETLAESLQRQLSTRTLRLYRTTDVTGAELGGALKNVVAIAAGVVIGAGFGDSARAALMTRGYAEMVRVALALGARAETLAGLSGFGDLVLTCTSAQSRNFRFGQALGAGNDFDPHVTVEGIATAQAVAKLAVRHDLEAPIASMVAAVIAGRVTIPEAAEALLSRPLKQE